MSSDEEGEHEENIPKNSKIYLDKVQSLFDKYENNPYMFQLFCYHLNNILPSSLDTEDKNHEKRLIRNQYLTNEQQQFIQIFLSKNKYYYLSNNNCFYQYNGKKYNAIKEDDIQHQLLTTISKDRTLMQWKYKTKVNIIKQIKERNLFKSIPETDTIQQVIQYLYPSIFANKNHAKYFLTVIGDNILKKTNDELVYLIKPKTKKFLSELDAISNITTGYANITHNFVTKFHENHEFANCRLININSNISVDTWSDILSKAGLDILCVAAYYSNRYGNSEQYIINNTDESVSKYTLYLKENTQHDIFMKFCKYSIEKVEETPSAIAFGVTSLSVAEGDVSLQTAICNPSLNPKPMFSINWKNMHYIWKLFISHYSLPSVIYSNTLKNLLKEQYSYDESSDSMINVTSKYLPRVSDFILFWENTMTATQDGEFDYELEMDELCGLFKKWNHDNCSICSSNGHIAEHEILKMVKHYFPHISIIENKYILNIKCNMWNKVYEIETALQSLKIYYKHLSASDNTTLLIPFDEIYDYYLKNKQIKFAISKRYFEKYLCTMMAEFIEFDNFISSSWYCK